MRFVLDPYALEVYVRYKDLHWAYRWRCRLVSEGVGTVHVDLEAGLVDKCLSAHRKLLPVGALGASGGVVEQYQIANSP